MEGKGNKADRNRKTEVGIHFCYNASRIFHLGSIRHIFLLPMFSTKFIKFILFKLPFELNKKVYLFFVFFVVF